MQIEDVVFVYQLSSPELIHWHSRRHAHGTNEYELHYFLGGDGRFETGRDRYVISHGALFFSRPGELHSIRPGDMHRPVSYYAVLFSLAPDNPLRAALDTTRFRQSFPRMAGSRHRLLFEDLKTGYGHIVSARRYAANHMLQSFLWDLAADADTGANTETGKNTDAGVDAPPGTGSEAPKDRTSDTGDPYNVHINRAVRLLEDHINTNITIAEVADALGISQAHLTRLFTYHFGVAPLQYYRRLRMDVAASLLLDTTRSIKEISWEMGYSNPFHFSRSFSRYAGMSPSAYRRQYYRTNPTRYETRVVSIKDCCQNCCYPVNDGNHRVIP